MEAVGIGDLHLSDVNGIGGLAKYLGQVESDKYVMSEVGKVFKWAQKKHINTAFLYGDICDGVYMSYSGMLAFIDELRRYPDMDVWAILGNHDKQAKESSVGHSMQIIEQMKIPNFHLVTEQTIHTIQKTKVNFCPWPSTAFNTRMLNVGHIEVRGAKTDSGRAMDSEELPKSKAVVCMGHLHTPHRIRNTYYSGTLHQKNFGESLPKFFHHIQWTSIDDYEISDIPFDPEYKLFNCVVEDQADVDALPKDPKHLIKLVVKDGADVVVPNATNIVINKTFKNKTELVSILTEDLMQGQELVIKTDSFFKRWIAEQAVPEHMKRRTARLRRSILSGDK